MTIPHGVRETVLRRVRRLSRGARDVVLGAAVIGSRFDLRVLTATLDADEPSIRAALNEACRLQITVADDASDRWSFRHALTRDIVYAELAAARVRPLHRRIVRVLERDAPDGERPLHDLAYHAWAARDVRRGIRYNEMAGDRAVAMHAHEDARLLYARARALSAVGSRGFVRLNAKLSGLGAGVGGNDGTNE